MPEQIFKKYMDNSLEAEQVSRCLRLHHAKALKTAKLLADDFSYIVYEADNIAAAADRREREDEGVDRGFDAQSCLQSVFNILENKPVIRLANIIYVG